MLKSLIHLFLALYEKILTIVDIFEPQSKTNFFYPAAQESDLEKYLPHKAKDALRHSGLSQDWSATINQFMLFTVLIYLPTQIWFSDKPWVLYFSFFGGLVTMFIKGVVGLKYWQTTLSSELAKAMRIVYSGLKVGLSIEECLHDASKYTKGPVQKEFRSIVLKIQEGMPILDAITSSRERIKDQSFDVFGYVLIINEQIGGSLAAVFGRLMNTLDQKSIFEKKIATLTSENKNTAVIINTVIIGMSIAMLEMGGTKDFFLYDPLGRKLAILQIFLIVVNAYVVHYMIKNIRPF